MARIALTGGTGLVGGVLVPLLLARGHTLRILARPQPGRTPPAMPGVVWVPGRLDEPEPVQQLVLDVDAIVHAAYLRPEEPPVGERTQAEHWVQSNFVGSMRLLERTAGTAMRQLVYVSSLAVYGTDPNQDPLGDRFARDEDFPLWPREFYGSIRSATEQLVITAAHSHGLNTSVFRLGHVLGLREPWTASPCHQTVAEAVAHGEVRTAVGSYALGVADAAAILADAVGDASLRGQVFNTFDRWFDHAEVALHVAAVLGRPVAVRCPPARPPRSPILGAKIHARHRSWSTEAAISALARGLAERCRRQQRDGG
jgi:nucleoside-diphosphate-sugar epimerase